jgi:hypothetical protein
MDYSDCLVLVCGPLVKKSQESVHLLHKLFCNFYCVFMCVGVRIKFTNVVVGHVTHAAVLCVA